MMPTMDDPVRIIVGDSLASLKRLPDASVHCWVTSPPYWNLRDYQCEGQIGLEKTPLAFINRLVELFAECHRVLHPSGTLWLNMGSSYAGGGGFSADAPTSKTSKSGQYGLQGGLKAGGVPVSKNGGELFALRDDLTADEIAYVLTELASMLSSGNEVNGPDVTV